ncbi:hypothetical protein GFV16_10775 [Bacillus megaterium]|uniref:hypothetical protein n=1 Tax=Priestia megaterium TaxID=1404 RepID=UPI001293C1CE|nr:hypothetical protein [Priestia megaterium]MQR86396.1 hypothetical protein [Priestia megaterium]
MNKRIKDRVLVFSIEAHKRILAEEQNVDLESLGFEKETPIDCVLKYNAFTILTKLNFGQGESVNVKSASTKYLNELVKKNPTLKLLTSGSQLNSLPFKFINISFILTCFHIHIPLNRK